MTPPRSLRFLPFAALAAALLIDVAPSHADAPPGRYTVQNGTVLDTKTMLTWQQTVPAASSTWANATAYCAGLQLDGGGYRLPSMKELQTIVDETRMQPAIDPQAFPNTPADLFWSSTPAKFDPTNTWIVGFDQGDTLGGGMNGSFRVRCVR